MGFQGPLRVEQVEGRKVKLLEPLAFVSGNDEAFSVPTGFVSDLASVPQRLQSVIGVWDDHAPAAVLHDWLYATNAVDRSKADALFFEAMTSLKLNPRKAWIMWCAVRLGGAGPYKTGPERMALTNATDPEAQAPPEAAPPTIKTQLKQIPASDFAVLWRNADPAWRDAFAANYQTWCARWGIKTDVELKHFLAQVSAETDGLNCDGRYGRPLPGMVENFKYSAERAAQVFDFRLKRIIKRRADLRGCSTVEAARRLIAKGQLAEAVYGDRPELGNTEDGDGAKYVGRSPLQCTGHDIYQHVSAELGIDCVENPHLLEQPEIGWQATFIEWHKLGCSALACDTADATLVKVSKRVNGGTNGLADRRTWLKRVDSWWPDDSDLETMREFEDKSVLETKTALVGTTQTATGTVFAIGGMFELAQKAETLSPTGLVVLGSVILLSTITAAGGIWQIQDRAKKLLMGV